MSLNKETSILVLTPAYGGQIYVGYLSSLLRLERLCMEKNIKKVWYLEQEIL